MAYALVGTIGAVSQGTAGASVTPGWGTGESRTAGNLLVCFVAVNGSATAPATPTGWLSAEAQGGTLSAAVGKVFYTIAAGGDAAPTVPSVTSGVIAAQLAEFSGNETNVASVQIPLHVVHPGGTLSPANVTPGISGDPVGRLACYAYAITYSTAATKTFTDTLNDGQVAHFTDNASTSTTNHYHFNWSVTSSNASAAQDSLAITTTKLTAWDAVGVFFGLPSPASPFQARTARNMLLRR